MQTRQTPLIWLISGLIFVLSALFFILAQEPDISKNSQNGLLMLAGIGVLTGALLIILQRKFAHLLRYLMDDSLHLWRDFIIGLGRWRNNTTSVHWFLLMIVISVGIGLRLLFIQQPMRTDESLTYLQFASKPLYLAIADYSAPNNHLLHTFGVWFTTHVFGDAEWSIRLTALIMGVLSIPLTYVAGRLHANAPTGLLAAALVAVSSVLIEYSTNARGYTLQTALFLGAVIIAFIALKSQRLTAFVILGVLLAFGFYTVPTMLYGAGGLMLWLGLSIVFGDNATTRSQQLGRWMIAGLITVALTGILYTPVFIVSGIGALTGNIYVQPLPMAEYIAELPQFVTDLLAHWHNGIFVIITVTLITGHAIGLIWHRRALQYPIPLLLILIGCSMLVILIQRVLPFFRVWLPFLPIYFMVGMAGFVYLTERIRLPRHLVTLVSTGGILFAGSVTIVTTQSPFWSTETGTFRDAAAVVGTLHDVVVTDDDFRVIYEHPSGESLRYYAGRMNLPIAWIQRDFAPHDVLYVVVNTEYPQSVESVMRLNNQDRSAYGIPEKLADFPQAELYRIQRHNN